MHALATGLAGLGLAMSLVVAIGAQNAYVLRQGLRGEHVGAVVAVCVVSDAVLVAAGVAGLDALVERVDGLIDLVRVVGALFLFGYAALSLRRALLTESLDASTDGRATSTSAAVSTAVALTWLNPHVYLDTVLLLGSVAQGYAQPWAFAAGAATGSLVWFVALGFGARYLRPLFARPASWRVLDVVVAVVMTAIGVSLLV